MLSICRTNKSILRFIGIIFFYLIASPFLEAQDNNPFEIRDRDLMDTVSVKVNDSSVNGSDQKSESPKLRNPETNQFENSTASSSDSGQNSADVRPTPIPNSTDQTTERKKQNSGSLSTDQGNDIAQPESVAASHWWVYIFDFIILILLLGAFLYDKTLFPLMQKAFRHENFLRFLYRDTYIRKPVFFIYLNALFLLCTGFFIFRAFQYLGFVTSFQHYLIIQSVVFLLNIIKHLSLYLISQFVDKPFEVKFYQYWLILSAGMIGVWMIPVVLMISVLPFSFIKIAMILTGIPLILLLIYRQVKAYIHAKFYLYKHLFQISLYFCAVEIVPIILFADILMHY